MIRSRTWTVVLLSISVFVIAASLVAYARAPQTDEAHRASEALTLLHDGHLGLSIVEARGTWLAGVDRHSYWVMPAYATFLSGVFAILPTSIMIMRAMSIAFGIVTLVSIYFFGKNLFGSRAIGAAALVILAVSYDFANIASNARADIMCVAFGWIGLALYVSLRHRSFSVALLSANTSIAISCLTHPYGGLFLLSLAIIVAAQDAKRLDVRAVLCAAAPYAIALVGWGLFISEDPASWHRQFFGNIAAGRMSSLSHPVLAIVREVRERYLGYFSGFGVDVPRVFHLKLLVTLSYAAGVAYLITDRLRHKSTDRRQHFLLLAPTALVAGSLAFFEGTKWYVYIIHLLPWLALVVAVSAIDAWRRYPHTRRAIVAAAGVLALLQIGIVAGYAWTNTFKNVYLPTVEYLRANSAPNGTIIGGAEFAFRLGFGPQLRDDYRLGFFSHVKPTTFVLNSSYRDQIAQYRRSNPEISEYVQRLLTSDCRKSYERGEYEVFLCDASTPAVVVDRGRK